MDIYGDDAPKRRGRKKKENLDNNENNFNDMNQDNDNYNYRNDDEEDGFETINSNNAQKGVTSDGTDMYSDEIPTEDSSPLKGQTIKRDYANYVNKDSIDPDSVPDLDEMDINPNDPNDLLNEGEDDNDFGGDGKKMPSSSIGDDLNLGDTNSLSDREQSLLAENTADTIFEAWDKVHELGRWLSKVSDDKLIEYHRTGKIDLQDVVTDENGNGITIADVFQGLNKNIDSVLVVEDDFKDKYKPALVREIKRRKLYMTDATYLAIGFGKSFVELGIATFSLRMNMNKQLKFFEQMHQENLDELKRSNNLREEELRLSREVKVDTGKNKTNVSTNLSSVTAEVIEDDSDFTTEKVK